eukprot:scaffold10922_cov147-Cylindrotheca_fusiformis.AAC.7
MGALSEPRSSSGVRYFWPQKRLSGGKEEAERSSISYSSFSSEIKQKRHNTLTWFFTRELKKRKNKRKRSKIEEAALRNASREAFSINDKLEDSVVSREDEATD